MTWETLMGEKLVGREAAPLFLSLNVNGFMYKEVRSLACGMLQYTNPLYFLPIYTLKYSNHIWNKMYSNRMELVFLFVARL